MKGTQIVISDSEDDSGEDERAGSSSIKAKPDTPLRSPESIGATRLKVSSSQSGKLSMGSNDDERTESTQATERLQKLRRSGNTARCSRGNKSSSKSSPIIPRNKVSSFKPLKPNCTKVAKEDGDMVSEPLASIKYAGSSNGTAKATTEASSPNDEESDEEEFHEPLEFIKGNSMKRKVEDGAQKANVKRKPCNVEDGQQDGEDKPVTSPPLEVTSTPTQSSSEACKKRKIRLADSEREDDSEVSMELASSSVDVYFSRIVSPPPRNEQVLINNMTIRGQLEPVATSSASREDQTVERGSRDAASVEASLPLRHESINREEMDKAIEQMRQEMRKEMAGMREAMRIDLKRLVRSEVKDEILLAQEEERK
ncbi:hypothetical protein CBS101457_005490 [Exobasidium rhododendri]|nr:hypothetical protein CBS101457_005490 [Exobasidium rhododendri]